ncbi:MAG: hypothetical protein K8F91_07265 [Candidatus Obscuribacterales bacterium]|nr:hypothetical protein [Candidatus Obscuribacterales bacterium]
MAQPKKNSTLAKVLKLVDELCPEELQQLRLQLKGKTGEVDLCDPVERTDFFHNQDKKACLRVQKAFENLRSQKIMDEDGILTRKGLPADMKPGAKRDFGG